MNEPENHKAEVERAMLDRILSKSMMYRRSGAICQSRFHRQKS